VACGLTTPAACTEADIMAQSDLLQLLHDIKQFDIQNLSLDLLS
jgi:hypothetical protein